MKPEQLFSILRHWTWADRQRELFEYYLRKDFPNITEDFTFDESFFVSSMATCMGLWYGLLYVTCEGIDDSGKVQVSSIAPEFDQKTSDLLRRFRNAMFHVQDEYWSPKLMDVLREPDTAEAIRAVHQKVGRWVEGETAKVVADILGKRAVGRG